MAITQVRALLDGQWVNLEYDSQSRCWVAAFTPQATSWHQPGHFFNIPLEAANDAGVSIRTDGDAFPGLRLVVNETDPPAITLVSPMPGIVTTNTPAWFFQAEDSGGGSGVDPSTLSVTMDGEPVQGSITGSSAWNYIISYTPSQPLAEGVHTIGVALADYDGNLARFSADYCIDTVPPRLILQEPLFRSVVDTPSIRVAGTAFDDTTPPVAVTLYINGREHASAVVDPRRGEFQWDVPLDVGANTITVYAMDEAGWEAAQEVFMIRLITDRAPADVDALRALEARPVPAWTAQEKASFLAARYKGSYDYTDLNRVTLAAAHLAEKFTGYGFSPGFVPVIIDTGTGRTEWQKGDMPLPALTQGYLQNVARLGRLLPVATAPPPSLEALTIQEANDIEKTLVLLDGYAPYLNNAFYAGEVYAGEV